MSKPNQCDLEIFFVPECQAVSGAAVAGTILPICSLAIFHTVSKGQTEIWAEVTHTSLVIITQGRGCDSSSWQLGNQSVELSIFVT